MHKTLPSSRCTFLKPFFVFFLSPWPRWLQPLLKAQMPPLIIKQSLYSPNPFSSSDSASSSSGSLWKRIYTDCTLFYENIHTKSTRRGLHYNDIFAGIISTGEGEAVNYLYDYFTTAKQEAGQFTAKRTNRHIKKRTNWSEEKKQAINAPDLKNCIYIRNIFGVERDTFTIKSTVSLQQPRCNS